MKQYYSYYILELIQRVIFFSEKWTCPPKEFRKHMDKWNENYVDTIRYENVIKYINNLFEQDIKDVKGYLG